MSATDATASSTSSSPRTELPSPSFSPRRRVTLLPAPRDCCPTRSRSTPTSSCSDVVMRLPLVAGVFPLVDRRAGLALVALTLYAYAIELVGVPPAGRTAVHYGVDLGPMLLGAVPFGLPVFFFPLVLNAYLLVLLLLGDRARQPRSGCWRRWRRSCSLTSCLIRVLSPSASGSTRCRCSTASRGELRRLAPSGSSPSSLFDFGFDRAGLRRRLRDCPFMLDDLVSFVLLWGGINLFYANWVPVGLAALLGAGLLGRTASTSTSPRPGSAVHVGGDLVACVDRLSRPPSGHALQQHVGRWAYAIESSVEPPARPSSTVERPRGASSCSPARPALAPGSHASSASATGSTEHGVHDSTTATARRTLSTLRAPHLDSNKQPVSERGGEDDDVVDKGSRAVEFHDLSERYFHISPVPREWYASEPHRSPTSGRGTSGRTCWGRSLSEHAAAQPRRHRLPDRPRGEPVRRDDVVGHRHGHQGTGEGLLPVGRTAPRARHPETLSRRDSRTRRRLPRHAGVRVGVRRVDARADDGRPRVPRRARPTGEREHRAVRDRNQRKRPRRERRAEDSLSDPPRRGRDELSRNNENAAAWSLPLSASETAVNPLQVVRQGCRNVLRFDDGGVSTKRVADRATEALGVPRTPSWSNCSVCMTSPIRTAKWRHAPCRRRRTRCVVAATRLTMANGSVEAATESAASARDPRYRRRGRQRRSVRRARSGLAEKIDDVRERVVQVKREADAKAPADHATRSSTASRHSHRRLTRWRRNSPRSRRSDRFGRRRTSESPTRRPSRRCRRQTHSRRLGRQRPPRRPWRPGPEPESGRPAETRRGTGEHLDGTVLEL